jgi:hypothetical protein
MNQTQDITASITSFHLSLTPRNLNKTDGSDGSLSTLAREIQQRPNSEARESVQGVPLHPSEPSEIMQVLPPDQAAWIPVAKQVLAGEFDGADGSTRASVTIGLRSIRHPTCQAALIRLWPNGLPKQPHTKL